jgi:nucleoside-diphosphate-sugar epimerase
MVKFAECIARDRHVTIFGDGTQTRDFIYSTDVAEATVRSAKCPEASGLAINVGTGVATSINELAKVMLELACRTNLGITTAEPKLGEITYSQADTTLAKKLLGFEARVSLREGVGKFLSWYATTRC